MGMDELSDTMLSVKKDIDPADIKMMKIKHRNKEMKEIVKADAEYLKAVFDRLEKMKDNLGIPSGGGMMLICRILRDIFFCRCRWDRCPDRTCIGNRYFVIK